MSAAETTSMEGRPSPGALLLESIAQSSERRPRQRNLGPLRALWPHVKDHAADAALALVFLLISTASTLGLSGAVRVLVN